MIIYYKDGWFEYRTFNGNCICNSFAGIKETVLNDYGIDLYTLLN